jgi:YfiR/HmsC-like
MRASLRWFACVVAVGALPAAGAIEAGRAPAGSLEYEIKAAFLYNFAKFIQWPPHVFASSDAPLTLCVLGSDPFGPTLDDTVRAEHVEGRPIAVARPGDPGAAAGCHIVFVSSSEEARFAGILSRLDRRVILTVGEGPSFLAAGGHVSFFLEGNHVRFAVNTAALRECDLQVSSKLLRVARAHPLPQGGR